MVVLDWLGKAIGLPAEFLSGGKGGGVIQVRLKQLYEIASIPKY